MVRVLLVDDEPFILKGLHVLIDWQKVGFKVCGDCSNAEDAFEYITEKKPHLVICDIKMPGMSGLELLQKVREQFGSNPYFIMLSGYSDFDYVRTAFKNNCTDYLLKPVNRNELYESLDKVKQLYLETHEEESSEKPVQGILSQVLEDMKLHFSDNLTLKDMGQKYFVNATYLGQVFAKKFGESFKDCLNRLRVEEAARLLEETDKPVYKICEQIGYKDFDYFINKFVSIKAESPSKYRKLHRAI